MPFYRFEIVGPNYVSAAMLTNAWPLFTAVTSTCETSTSAPSHVHFRELLLQAHVLNAMQVIWFAGVATALGLACAFMQSDNLDQDPSLSRSGLLREVLDPWGHEPSGKHPQHTPLCRPVGQIQDACSDYESVETLNDRHIFDRLDNLRKTKYFRYFYVDLFKDCPFWNDNGLCMNRACTVERMNETDLPDEFRSYRLSELEHSEDDATQGSAASGDSTNFCQLDDEDFSGDAIYVDLLKNPERFTGYAGPSANNVWRSIYEENCFGGIKYHEPPRPETSGGGSGFVSRKAVKNAIKGIPPSILNPDLGVSDMRQSGLDSLIDSVQAPIDPASMEQCMEKRMFYRVISGLHASISIHICNEYLDPETKTWGPNLECFITRISQHPERLQNVYFDYVLLMRALSKLGEYLDKFDLRPGDEIQDHESRTQLRELLRRTRESKPSFDEHQLFTLNDDPLHNSETLQLKEDFRLHFRNISRIMDCVGCDKCRLWGKVQVTGIGTALKLLFAFEASNATYVQRDIVNFSTQVTLRRNELVSLINTAHRVSESVRHTANCD